MKPLILIGGGGHCKSVIDAAESAGYTILGVLDMPENVGKNILNTQIIGTDEDIPSFVNKAEFIITVGFIKDSSTRVRLYNRIKEVGGRLATVVASSAYVSKHAVIGEGSVVLHQAFVNADAKVGYNVIVNTASIIEHDAVVGNHCHISTGAIVNGECKVGERCFIGSQSVLANCISIDSDVVVGAGSFIKKSISEKGIYCGNPATLKVKKP